MTDVTSAPIYEVLKSIQLDVGRLRTDIREVKFEVQAVRSHVMGVQQDISNICATLGDHGKRLDRIETRLGLLKPAH
ncbi:hypothetical protein [Brevundimonas sp. SL130]|uniref:hypothetical protein n=1 Tax=Brevundimonas sp. SL130 TaxID=2995143 RepID=UPI00226D3765|nr:hypothetical protein [Brevundimonas sp. SL130]WAC59225.1 hypothetical protein OU998_13505 [Brevundimonas sp. SL130]